MQALSAALKYRAAMAQISPILRALTSPPMTLSFATARGLVDKGLSGERAPVRDLYHPGGS